MCSTVHGADKTVGNGCSIDTHFNLIHYLHIITTNIMLT